MCGAVVCDVCGVFEEGVCLCVCWPCGEKVVDKCGQLRMRGDVLLGRLGQLSLLGAHTAVAAAVAGMVRELSIRCVLVRGAGGSGAAGLTLLCSRCSSSSRGVTRDMLDAGRDRRMVGQSTTRTLQTVVV